MTALKCEIEHLRSSYKTDPYKARSTWSRKSAKFDAFVLKKAEVVVNTKATGKAFYERTSRSSRQADSIRIQTPISLSLQRLFDLLAENGKDDHGLVSPTQFALKTACEFVLYAEWELGRDVKSAPVVDSEGGIRITWRNGNKQVKLICPATPNAPIYIYYSSPTGSYVQNQDVTFAVLADRISWLLNGDQSEQPS